MDPVATGMSTTTTLRSGGDENVQVAKASPADEYQTSLQIVLGTVFGVVGFVGILVIGTLLYRFFKNRRHSFSNSGNSERHTISAQNRSVSIDLEQKQVPSVLLLYSHDCAAHEKVAEALAGFLIETCNCNVHVDLFEEQIIHECGLNEWLVEKLQEAEFIIVLSSVGARLRCSKKKVKFKVDPMQTLPDYFAIAVDYVAEKMRVERAKAMPLNTFCIAYFDYSTASDIPPQLEMGFKFCLMKDINALFCHLHGIDGEPTKDGAPISALSEDSYHTTELGAELHVAIESAKEYFRANPGWVEDRIEPVPNPSKSKSRIKRKSSLEPLLGSSQNETLETEPHDPSSQTLPKSKHSVTRAPMQEALKKKRTSFSSSLSSRQSMSTPPLQKNSKSCDNLDFSNSHCDLCGGDLHLDGIVNCPAGQPIELQQGEHNAENQNENGRLKSKSMPTVYRNSLYSSQTVFQAEVHKEWDDRDKKLSRSNSQDTSSNHDSVIDDLEKDVNSIVNPGMITSEPSSHISSDNLTSTYSGLSMSTNLAEIIPQIPTNFTLPTVHYCDEGQNGGKIFDFVDMTEDHRSGCVKDNIPLTNL